MFDDATALYERARNWTVGSDPGLLRLRMATRTTGALATALLALFLLTKATGQPLTVALLGVLITMISARSVNDSDPRRQRITMALLPLPTALGITAAALLSPHPLVADVLFVVVVFGAAYARRFGPRGTALGMVTFISYFFSLYLRAKFSELPWLIGATLVGSLCSFVWSAFLMPDRPESVLRENIRSLRARIRISLRQQRQEQSAIRPTQLPWRVPGLLPRQPDRATRQPLRGRLPWSRPPRKVGHIGGAA